MSNVRFLIPIFVLTALACGLPTTVATTPEAATDAPTEAPTLVTVVTDADATPASTTAPGITHVDVPANLPELRSAFAADQESYVTSLENRASGGDRFTFGRYERPFNAETMDVYLPYIDITETSAYRDDTWIYFTVTLRARDTDSAFSGKYAVEIDSDIDGRGDWLVLVLQPAANDWTTDRVEVWFDSNNDVGGSLSVTSDTQSGGDGYDKNLFASGVGDDPDLAWARIPADQPFTIQFAVKSSLVGATAFMAGAWAGNTLLDPALFDINDRFTHEQAGSSLVEFEVYYPIKAVAEIDNVCRVAIGFQAKGGEPGLCPLTSNDGCAPPAREVCVDTIYGEQCSCSGP
jgi:hypothetical protein